MREFVQMLASMTTALDIGGAGKWMLAIPLICLFGRLRLCTAMSTRRSGRWPIRTCVLVLIVLFGLCIALTAVGAVCLYAWVTPQSGFGEAAKKLEEVLLSFFPNGDPASSLIARSFGQLVLIGLASIWGAGAVWAAQSGIGHLQRFWREIPHGGGVFLREPKLQFLDDGRKALVLENYSFQDPRGKIWTAPAGTVVDGGSIPRFFWRSFGPPFVGRYRNASIIHDFYCQTRRYDCSEVHRMFYEACLAEGLSLQKARIAYWSVRSFGPDWEFAAHLRSGKDELPPHGDSPRTPRSTWTPDRQAA